MLDMNIRRPRQLRLLGQLLMPFPRTEVPQRVNSLQPSYQQILAKLEILGNSVERIEQQLNQGIESLKTQSKRKAIGSIEDVLLPIALFAEKLMRVEDEVLSDLKRLSALCGDIRRVIKQTHPVQHHKPYTRDEYFMIVQLFLPEFEATNHAVVSLSSTLLEFNFVLWRAACADSDFGEKVNNAIQGHPSLEQWFKPFLSTGNLNSIGRCDEIYQSVKDSFQTSTHQQNHIQTPTPTP
jgi:hypothetical protein